MNCVVGSLSYFEIQYGSLCVSDAPRSVIIDVLMKFREMLMMVLVGASGDGLMQDKKANKLHVLQYKTTECKHSIRLSAVHHNSSSAS